MRSFLLPLLLVVSISACGGSISSTEHAQRTSNGPGGSSVDAGAPNVTPTSCVPPSVLVSAPGTGISSLMVSSDSVYWTSLIAAGGSGGSSATQGSVWRVGKCGGAPTQLAAGRASPASLVAAGGELVWSESWTASESTGGASLVSMSMNGGAVATLVSYAYDASSGPWEGRSVSSLAADTDGVYWSGVHSVCWGPHTCTNSVYLASVAAPSGTAQEPATLFEYAYPYPDSLGNLVVEGDGVYMQEGGSLLRVPKRGGAPTVLDRRNGTEFLGNALSACGSDVCWFGMASAGQSPTLGYVRASATGSTELVALPPLSDASLQRLFLGTDGNRIYFAQGNTDTWTKPVLDLRSAAMSGQDSRVVEAGVTPTAMTFDDTYVYFVASDAILVLPK